MSLQSMAALCAELNRIRRQREINRSLGLSILFAKAAQSTAYLPYRSVFEGASDHYSAYVGRVAKAS